MSWATRDEEQRKTLTTHIQKEASDPRVNLAFGLVALSNGVQQGVFPLLIYIEAIPKSPLIPEIVDLVTRTLALGASPKEKGDIGSMLQSLVTAYQNGDSDRAFEHGSAAIGMYNKNNPQNRLSF